MGYGLDPEFDRRPSPTDAELEDATTRQPGGPTYPDPGAGGWDKPVIGTASVPPVSPERTSPALYPQPPADDRTPRSRFPTPSLPRPTSRRPQPPARSQTDLEPPDPPATGHLRIKRTDPTRQQPSRPAQRDSSTATPVGLSPKTRHWVGGGLGVLLLLAICGVGSYLVRPGESTPDGDPAAQRPGASATTLRDLSSRAVDPVPLTIREVFPQKEIVVRDGEPPYQMVRAAATRDCLRIAEGRLRDLLRDTDCSQVVYGTLRSPDGKYLMNAGILNLVDATQANQVYRDIKPLLDDRLGWFQAPSLGTTAAPVPVTASRTGWHVRGHFLFYSVLVRSDGARIDDPDPVIRQFLSDLIESHLRGVLQKRAATPARTSSPG